MKSVLNDCDKWTEDGMPHRTDGPAIVNKSYKAYYIHGNLHRVDGPAVEYANGDKEYYINDNLHRDGGPALIWADGGYAYYQHGILHRINGPAMRYITTDDEGGFTAYYQHGLYHREDGPALIWDDGILEYWIDGDRLSKNEYNMYNFVNSL